MNTKLLLEVHKSKNSPNHSEDISVYIDVVGGTATLEEIQEVLIYTLGSVNCQIQEKGRKRNG